MNNAKLSIPPEFKMPFDDVKIGKMYVFNTWPPHDKCFNAPYCIVTILQKIPAGKFNNEESFVRVAGTGAFSYIPVDQDRMVPLIPIELEVVFPPEGGE